MAHRPTKSRVEISAVVCTYNRAGHLNTALESLVRQTLDPSCYEILVVDNCSTDGTQQLVNDVIGSYHGYMRYVREEQQGLSFARNRAIKEARGDILSFLDDDATANPDWLKTIRFCFTRVSPRPAVVGGPVRLKFELSPPSWDLDELETLLLFSGMDYGKQPRWMSEREGAVGANVAYDRVILLREGLQFSTDLGRMGRGLLGGEEGELLRLLRERGYDAYYHPDAWVWHLVLKERVSSDYALKRFYWVGRTHAIRWYLKNTPNVRSICRRIWTSGSHLGWLFAKRTVGARSLARSCWRTYWTGMTVELCRILVTHTCNRMRG